MVKTNKSKTSNTAYKKVVNRLVKGMFDTSAK